MLCYCGECPENIARAEDYTFWCFSCAEELDIKQRTWEDDLDIKHNYCTGCGRRKWVIAIHKG